MKGLRKRLSCFFKISWPVFFIIFLIALFFWKFFFFGLIPIPGDFVVGTYYPWLDYKWGYVAGVPVKNPITTDVVSFSYPMRILAIKLLKKGEIPLWNPYIFTGTPLLANFQSAPFSITNLFYFLFDEKEAWGLQVISQHFFVAFFTYLLLRHWKLSKISSIFAGIVFAFSGFNLIWSQWNSHTLTASFIPILILFVDNLITKDRKFFWGILFSIFLCLQIFSGYPQVILYTGLAIILFLFVSFKKLNLKKFLSFFFFSILGLGLAAAQILPAAELMHFSQREKEPLEEVFAFLSWNKVITFIAPDYFGNHSTRNYWGVGDYTMNTGFVGVFALVLALSSLSFKKNRITIFASVLFFISLALAFPTPLSLAFWKSGLLGLQAASMHRALVLFTFSISILSAFALDDLIYRKKSAKILPSILVFLIFIGFASFAIFSFFNPNAFFLGIKSVEKWKALVSIRNLVLPLFFLVSISVVLFLLRKNLLDRKLAVFLIFALTTLEIFRFGWKFTPFSSKEIIYPDTPVFEFLRSQEKPYRITTTNVIPVNIKMAYELESVEGYDAIYPVSIANFIAFLNSEKIGSSPQGRYGTVSNLESRLLDLTNTKFFLDLKKDALGKPSPDGKISYIFSKDNYKVVFEDKTTLVIENKNAFPRAFMVYEWETIEDDKEVLRRLISPNFDLGKKVLLSGFDRQVKLGFPKRDAKVVFKKYSEQNTELEVETDTNGLLFVSDLYYPGWKVYIDGVEDKIYKANYAFRAVFIPKGNHRVSFIYQPESFARGLYLSTASLAILVISLFYYSYIIRR